MSEEILRLKNENKKLKSDAESSKIVADLLQRENKHLREENESLQAEIDVMDKTREKSSDIIHQLAESQQRINELENQIADFKRDYVPKSEYDELKDKIETLTEERDMAKESLKQVDELYKAIEKLVNENEELKRNQSSE